MNSDMQLGFTYLVEVIRDGVVVDSEIVHNIVPLEGITHILNVVLKGGVQNTLWYVGVYSGNYTPSSTDTIALFPGAAGEVTTTYNETARPAWTGGTPTNGSVDNSASPAQFTSNAVQTIYGGFITSTSPKGSTSGVLLSAVKFASPKQLDGTSVLKVTAGIAAVSS